MKKLETNQVEAILLRYFMASPERKRHMVRELADEYNVSKKAIRDILKGINYAYIRPEIPRIFVSGHGNAWISDMAVQQIRATWGAYPERQGKGLQSALSRKTGVSEEHLSKIIQRKVRVNVPDDPKAKFDISELPFPELHKEGEEHPNSKISNANTLEIHRLFHEEGLSRSEIASRFGVTHSCVGMILSGASRVKAYEEYHGHPPDRN